MKKKSIWIIDDDAIYKFVIQKLIAKSDLFDDVKTFSNGEEASNALKNEGDKNALLPDIILLDIEMPRMDGWEFMSEIEAFLKMEDQKNIKIGKEIIGTISSFHKNWALGLVEIEKIKKLKKKQKYLII